MSTLTTELNYRRLSCLNGQARPLLWSQSVIRVDGQTRVSWLETYLPRLRFKLSSTRLIFPHGPVHEFRFSIPHWIVLLTACQIGPWTVITSFQNFYWKYSDLEIFKVKEAAIFQTCSYFELVRLKCTEAGQLTWVCIHLFPPSRWSWIVLLVRMNLLPLQTSL